MMPHAMGQIQDMGEGHLCHGHRAVGRDVRDDDACFCCSDVVHDIVAGCEHADVAERGECFDRRAGQERLVGEKDLRPRCPRRGSDPAGCGRVPCTSPSAFSGSQLRSPGFSVYPSSTTIFMVPLSDCSSKSKLFPAKTQPVCVGSNNRKEQSRLGLR